MTTFPALEECEGEIADREQKLRAIFDEAGADLDMKRVTSVDAAIKGKSDEILAYTRKLGDEIDALRKEREGLLRVREIVDAHENGTAPAGAVEGVGVAGHAGAAKSTSVWPFLKSAGARVVSEPELYRQDGPNSWVKDVFATTVNPTAFDAQERLARHAKAATKVMTSFQPANSLTAGGALTPPIWLIDELATVARAGRPLADAIGSQPLPGGVDQVMVPIASQGGATAVVPTETSTVGSQDWVTAQLNSQISTIAGTVDISQALIDQSPASVDSIIFGDLLADLALRVDDQLINGTGANNQINGLTTLTPGTVVTYTSAGPKFTSATNADSFVYQLAKAINAMWTGRKLAPQVILMHSRRWAWITTALDSQTRPMIVPEPQTGPAAFGRLANVNAQSVVGVLNGVPVLVDQSIPTNKGGGTNQDEVYVLRLDDMRLWETAPVARAFPQPLADKLQVRLQVYGYVAAILNRYASSIVRITGTGLVDPGL